MKAAMILALSLPFFITQSPAASAEQEHVGDLVCSVRYNAPETNITCVFRNKNTGLEETYEGRLVKAGREPVSFRRTLLWEVNANSKLDLRPGVLAQRYAVPEGEQTNAKRIEGDGKLGVSLSLITDRNDDLTALIALTVELKLLSATT